MQTFLRDLSEGFQSLEKPIRQQLRDEGFADEDLELERTLDVRYVGQSYELNLPFGNDFGGELPSSSSAVLWLFNPGLPMEIVNIRVRGSGKYPKVPIARFPLDSEEPPEGAMIHEKKVLFDGRLLPTAFYLRERLRPGNRLKGRSSFWSTAPPRSFQTTSQLKSTNGETWC